MSLPEITLPFGFPAFRSTGHGIRLKPLYSDVDMAIGAVRKRRICTVAPRAVTVDALVTAVQVAELHDFYEETLHAGELSFSVRVANQGPGTLWWQAQCIEPFREEPLGNGWWRVSGNLLLSGDGQVDSPYTPALTASFSAPLRAVARLSIGKPLSASITVALT